MFLYKTPGHDAILPCSRASPSDTTCSIIKWFFSKDRDHSLTEVTSGKVQENSAEAARLSLNPDCSLLINNITAEDAGLYSCYQDESHYVDIYLSVLTSESRFHENSLIRLSGVNSFFSFAACFLGQNSCVIPNLTYFQLYTLFLSTINVSPLLERRLVKPSQ